MRKYKNIRLRKSPIVIDRVKLINKVIKGCLIESFNSIIETEYIKKEYGDIIIYRFITNKGNSYDLEFILSYLNCNTKIDNGVLGDYVTDESKINIINKCFIPVIDIAFVPSEVNLNDRDNEELYNKETNRGDHIELMGRISYLVKEFIENHKDINVYVVGKDTKDIKLNIYQNMFYNLFGNDYIGLNGENVGYDNGSYYFIKK